MKVDMSAKAVTARLKLVSQLRRLCLSLSQTRPIDPNLDKTDVDSGRKDATQPQPGAKHEP